MTPATELRLELDPAAVGEARRFMRDAFCPRHQQPRDEAVLVVSELVTNGVRHGAPPIVVHVECQGTVGVRVTVSDAAPASPERKTPDADAETGRGIMLVDYVSREWGVTSSDRGKSVWALL